MLRTVLGLIFLTSCSMGTVKTGGDRAHLYDPTREYSLSELQEISGAIVTTLKRDPPVEKLDRLFKDGQKPLKRVGIIVFESLIQPTRGGLAGEDKIYLSAQGKQLLTEQLLHLWEEAFPLLAEDLSYVPVKRVISSPSFKKFGMAENDHVKARRTKLAPDDIFFREKGQKTTTTTLLNPRKMRDLSLALVPATELMHGPKWSEHQKHFVNDIMKELKLDAALVVMSELSWTASHVDKHSGIHVPEEMALKLSASTLVSLSEYHERLAQLGFREKPGVTLCYRAYEGELRVPAELSVSGKKQDYAFIERNLLTPLLKTYKDLAVMTIQRMSEDMRKTH